MKPKFFALVAAVVASGWLLWPLVACDGGCIVDFERSFARDPFAGHLMAPDTRLNIWILWWVQHALTTDPRALFDGNVFWPARNALAGSEHMISLALLTLPLRLFTQDAVVVYVAAIASMSILAGLSAYALVHWLTLDVVAGMIAAGVAVLLPWRVSELVHLQLLSGGLIPLVWLYCARVLTEPISRRRVAALMLFWALPLFASYYVAYFALFSTAALACVVAVAFPAPARRVTAAFVGAATPALALAALSLPYVRTQDTGALALRGETLRSLAPSAVLAELAPKHWLGSGGGPWAGGYSLPSTVVALAVFGIASTMLAARRSRTTDTGDRTHVQAVVVAGIVAAIVVALVMSLGWTLAVGGREVPLPAGLAARWLPGFANLRGPLRWTLVICVAAPILVGVAISAIRKVLTPVGSFLATTATLVSIVALIVDLRPPRLLVAPAYAARDAEMPGLRALAGFPDGPVLDVPWPQNLVTNSVVASEYMVASTVHAKPILAGYTAYTPRAHDLVLRASRNLPRADAVRRIRALTGLRWVVLHEAMLSAAERLAWQTVATQVPMVLAYRDPALTIYELPDHEVDPQVLAALRAGEPRETTVLGLSRAPLALEASEGLFQASVPPTLAGYAGDWMKSAVSVRIENRSALAWPGLDADRNGLLLVRYRLLADRKVVVDGLADLDADVAAGEALDSFVVVEGHVSPGEYRLELSLVQQSGAGVVPLPFAPAVGATRVTVGG